MAEETEHISSDHRQLYDIEPYHIEKYVIPGAVAVTVFFLIPWYLLGGEALGTLDLGTTIIGALVAGHLIESLRVYQWGRLVRKNFQHFNSVAEGVLAGAGALGSDRRKSVEDAKSALFTLIGGGERSEFAWNLVRWQKMTAIAAILFIGAFQWLMFAALSIAEINELNPFKCTFSLVFLKTSTPAWASVCGAVIISVILFVSWHYIYKFGLSRQARTNDFYLQLIITYKDAIVRRLAELQKGPR